MNVCDFKVGPTLATMRAARSVFGSDPEFGEARPMGASMSELSETHAYTMKMRGYPRASWRFESLPDWKLAAAQHWILNSTTEFSGECYVRTCNAFGVWANYRCIARFPDTIGLERMGDNYNGTEISFILLEAV